MKTVKTPLLNHPMTFWVKDKRKALNITVKQAAEEIKVSVRAYQRKELKNNFTIQELVVLANLLNVSILIIDKGSITKL